MITTATAIIEPAAPSDADPIRALLATAGLPHEDLTSHRVDFLVARAAGEVVGAIGAERAGADALLRSFVVAPGHRGAGLGGRLFAAIDAAAAMWGVRRWWLLTTTAEAFFAARGFRVVERTGAPAAIRRTDQFRGGVCRSAVCMTRERGSSPSGAGFDQVLADFSDRLRGFVRRRVRDDATADDLTQETLLKVYRSRESLRDDQRLEAWVYRIARTTIIDYHRRQRPSDELPESLAAEAPDEVASLREAVMRSTRAFLEELPEVYREPVRLAEFESLPLAKIALRLNLSLTAVKSRVRRGRAMLKKKLQDCCRFEFDRQGRMIGYERRRPCPC